MIDICNLIHVLKSIYLVYCWLFIEISYWLAHGFCLHSHRSFDRHLHFLQELKSHPCNQQANQTLSGHCLVIDSWGACEKIITKSLRSVLTKCSSSIETFLFKNDGWIEMFLHQFGRASSLCYPIVWLIIWSSLLILKPYGNNQWACNVFLKD